MPMDHAVKIEEANAADRAFVVESLAELQGHEARLHDTRKSGEPALCQAYFDEIAARARANNGALLVASVEARRAGFLCYWIQQNAAMLEVEDSNRAGYVSDIFVVPEHRGSGIAGLMLEEAARRLRHDASIKLLRICSLAMNSSAVAAYGNAGFQPYEIIFEKLLR
jgi:GNAT superfamily N-acetyltransferase